MVKTLLSKIVNYITRSWNEEPNQPHPRLQILPPFAIDFLAWFLRFTIVYVIVKALFEKFF